MKIREGFVSNSSSSSFVCKICCRTAEGWDWNNSSDGIVTCKEGHNFCYTHGLNKDDEFWNCLKNDEEFPVKYCPVCQGYGKYSLSTVYRFLTSLKESEGFTEREFIEKFIKWEKNR